MKRRRLGIKKKKRISTPKNRNGSYIRSIIIESGHNIARLIDQQRELERVLPIVYRDGTKEERANATTSIEPTTID